MGERKTQGHKRLGRWLAASIAATLLAVSALPLLSHTAVAAGVPIQPSNISPANGTSSISLTHTFRSSDFSHPDSEASHYASQWQVTTVSGDYSRTVVDSGVDTANLTQMVMPPGVLVVNTTYYWHVRHQDSFGSWSSWSSETSFTTIASGNPIRPTNTSPANMTTDILLTPVLQSSPFVSPDRGATHAASQWQITTKAGDYSSTVFDSRVDTAALVKIGVSPGVLVANTTYYWHVRHQDSYGHWSDYSQETSFTTIAAPPPAVSVTYEPPQPPVAISPSGATNVSLTPTLESSAFFGSQAKTGGEGAYIEATKATHAASQWQVTTKSGDYSSPVFDSGRDVANLVNISYPDILVVNTTYYWRVRHQDNFGNWSNWSFEASFTTIASEIPIRPTRPVNTSPGNRTIDILLTPTLQSSPFVSPERRATHAASQWQITTRAGDYSIPLFDSSVDIANLTKIGMSRGVLAFNTTYYWHVRYQDSYGSWSDYSQETSFTTVAARPPRQPAIVSPSDRAANIGLRPALQASAFPSSEVGATHAASQWQITAKPGDYSSTVFDTGVDTANLTEIAMPAGVLVFSTTYYWHVRYQDGYGSWSTYSQETSFTTLAARPPRQPAIVSPADAATNISLTPALESSAFSGSEMRATHTASQWQITTKSGDYSIAAFDSRRDTTNLIKISVSPGVLAANTAYYWHVRYQDSYGNWSNYSRETSFTTAATAGIKANFSATPTKLAIAQTTTFADLSTGDITSWIWDFGDGATVKWTTQTRPENGQLTHAYSGVGSYKVSLEVSGPPGENKMEKPGYVTVSTATASPPAASAPGPRLPWVWILVAAVVVIGGVVLIVARRRK